MYISLGIAHIGITINYSFSGEVHNKNMKTWALGIFYKCTNWLGWKSLSEIGVQHIRSLHWEVVWMCGCSGCTNMIVSKPYKGVRLNLGYLSIRPQPISQPREHPIEVPGQIQIQAKFIFNYKYKQNSYSITYFHKKTLESRILVDPPLANISTECKTNTNSV